jgi:hypothetical protein
MKRRDKEKKRKKSPYSTSVAYGLGVTKNGNGPPERARLPRGRISVGFTRDGRFKL